jgi:hypothetical protein
MMMERAEATLIELPGTPSAPPAITWPSQGAALLGRFLPTCSSWLAPAGLFTFLDRFALERQVSGVS